MNYRLHKLRRFMRAPDGEEPQGGSPPTPPPAPVGGEPPAGGGEPPAGGDPPAAAVAPEWAKGFGVEKPEHVAALAKFESADAMFAALNVEPPAPDPDAWRKAMAGDDEEKVKRLERFTDPAAVFKAFEDAQEHIRASGRVKLPGDGAPAEEVAAFAKAWGLPEKAEDFKITSKPVEGYDATDGDKAFLASLNTRLHAELGKNPRPDAIVNVAHDVFWELAAKANVELEEKADSTANATNKALDTEWGAGKKTNMAYYNAAIEQHFGADGAAWLKGARLDDGSYLIDHLPFVKGFASIGRATVDDQRFLEISGAGNGGGADLDAQYKEAMALRITDPKAYATPEHQAKITALITARQARDARKSA